MNLFNGLTSEQIVSFAITMGLFGGYTVLVAMALALFRVASKPRHGRVRTAAIWHVAGLVWFILAIISTVWGAPAEKSFVDPANNFFPLGYDRFDKILIGIGFAGAGLLCLVVGVVMGGRQKRAWRQQALSG